MLQLILVLIYTSITMNITAITDRPMLMANCRMIRLSSAFYNRVVDVMEELVKFTVLTRGRLPYLVDRYSERIETAAQQSERVNSTQSE